MFRVLSIIFALCIAVPTLRAENLESAKWIGVPSDDLPLYPDYLPVFVLEYDVVLPAGTSASIVYGVDDPRLMAPHFNIYGLASAPGNSGIRVETTSDGTISVFRFGYHTDDDPSVALATLKTDRLTESVNHIRVASNLGVTEIFVNGVKAGRVHLNPVGKGGDYLAFPVLAGVRAELDGGSGAEISGFTVRNFRHPGNVLFHSDEVIRESSRISLPERSMPEVKTTFFVKDPARLTEASVIATARGIYDLYVNGHRVSDDYFYPGSTQYNRTHLFHGFDVLSFLHAGENEVMARLAEGWWSGGATYVGENWNFFGDRQSFIAEITLRYGDGSVQRIVTEPDSWSYSVDGPLKVGSFFQGEIFDASVSDVGRIWRRAQEISTDSTVCREVGRWDEVNLRPSYGDRVVAVDTIRAQSVSEPRPGVYVYDLGQNIAGVPMLEFENAVAASPVSVRYAEVLYPDMDQYAGNAGMIMTENLRAAMCRDIFIPSGTSRESFSPRFTLHGFRYIELSGLDSPLPVDAVKGVAVSSIHDFKAGFECSDTLINRLWKNIEWSARSNFISIPTDCPQRNERLGWMGDISVFAPTATRIADVSALLRQYLTSVRDCRGEDGRYPDVAPTGFGFGGLLWGSAGITVPWEYWRQYGDIDLLKEHYPSMKEYIRYILSSTIDPDTGLIVQQRAWGDLGDWLSPEYDRTDKSLLWECYFIYDLGIMERVAALLGDVDGAEDYRRLREERTAFFIDTYVDAESGKTIYSGFVPEKAGQIVDTQVSYALPIAMGIYNDRRFVRNFLNTVGRESVADDGTVCPPYSLMTGFIGTAWILEALSVAGRSDMAYRMLTNTSYPSWLYPVCQGATTVWERLDSYTREKGFGKHNSMNSFNHYSFGSVGHWLLTRCLGIEVLPDGSVSVMPEPDPDGIITYARGWLDVPGGRVSVSWHKDGDCVEVEIDAPESVRICRRYGNQE